MKKLLTGLLIVFLLTVSTGCGVRTTITQDGKTIEADKERIQVTSKDGKSEYAVNEEGGVELPDGYPRDLVPIIEGGKIVMANRDEKNDKSIGYWITVISEKQPKETLAYYEAILKDAQGKQKFEMDNTYTVSGVIKGKNITVTVIDEDENGKKRSNIQIMIEKSLGK